MCKYLYIGSDNELQIIVWQSGKELLLYVDKLSSDYDDDDFADKYLTKEYKYRIGSWQGCACSFYFDFPEADKTFSGYSERDKKQIEAYSNRSIEDYVYGYDRKGRQSVEALFEYIRTNVIDDCCELLSIGSGERKVERTDIINLKSFVLGDKFSFIEGLYITVNYDYLEIFYDFFVIVFFNIVWAFCIYFFNKIR